MEGLGLRPSRSHLLGGGGRKTSPKQSLESDEAGNGAQSLSAPGQQGGHDTWSLGAPPSCTPSPQPEGRSKASGTEDALGLSSKVFPRFSSWVTDHPHFREREPRGAMKEGEWRKGERGSENRNVTF